MERLRLLILEPPAGAIATTMAATNRSLAKSIRLAASISCKCLPAKPLLAATLECYNCDA
jgi:hypothetical protein